MAASSGVIERRRLRLPFSPWHLVLVPATIVLIFPFVWLIVTSVETPAEALHFRRS
jgi:multiple sugar transport system permease protein